MMKGDSSTTKGRSFTSAQEYVFMTQDLEDAFNIAVESEASPSQVKSRRQSALRELFKSKTQEPADKPESPPAAGRGERLFSIKKRKVPAILRPKERERENISEIDKLLNKYSYGSGMNDSSEMRGLLGGSSRKHRKVVSKIMKEYSQSNEQND